MIGNTKECACLYYIVGQDKINKEWLFLFVIHLGYFVVVS